jgi:hypothetical protein
MAWNGKFVTALAWKKNTTKRPRASHCATARRD